MCEAMGMDEVAADIGYDLNTEIIVARAMQLKKMETEKLAEKTSSNYNLHRKVKSNYICKYKHHYNDIHGLCTRSNILKNK